MIRVTMLLQRMSNAQIWCGIIDFDNEDIKLYQYYYQFKCNDWFLSDCLLPCRTDCDRWTKATNWAIFGYIVIPQSDNVVTDHVNCTNEGKDALTPDYDEKHTQQY